MFGNLSGFEAGLFDNFRRLEREMEHVFDTAGIRATSRGYPPLNMVVSPDQVEVYLFAPGIDPKQLEITLHQNLLTIKGARKLEGDGTEHHQYYRRERFEGDFHRAVNLPEDADPEKVEANYKNGVLHVAIQRREADKPRLIEVK